MPFPNLNGRPVEYTDDIPNKVFEYIEECKKNDELPTKAGFGCYINISKATLYNWCDKYPQLLDALGKQSLLQESMVVQKALKNEYNSTIAKLILTNNHGYTDKVVTDNTNKNIDVPVDESLPVEQRLQDVLNRIKELQK